MVRFVASFVMCVCLVAGIPAFAQQSGWLGISIEDQKEAGAVVRKVEPNSPAEKAGLKSGDVILQYNKENVLGAQQLTRLVRETPVGRSVELRVHRDSGDQTIQITTEEARFPGGFNFQLNLPNPPNPPNPPNLPDLRVLRDKAQQLVLNMPQVEVTTTFVQAGIRVQQMTDQLRTYFGAAANTGVLVSSIEAGSAAEKAGLKPGDVIIAIDGKNIRTPAEFSREMRSANGKASVKVIRDKQERELKID